CRGAVVGLVGGGDRGGDRARVDRCAGRGAVAGQGVVAGVVAAEGDVGGDRVAAGAGGAEQAVAGRAGDLVVGDDAVSCVGGLERAAGDRRCRGAVVGLVGGGDRGGDRERVGRWGGRGAVAGQGVVAGVVA